MRLVYAVAAAAFATVVAAPALAQHPVTQDNPGAAIIVGSTDDIIATYLGTSAAFSNDLFLQNTGQFLFNNQETAVGTTVNLGSFAVGTELIFRLFVRNTGDNFYSGSPSRNVDGLGHAAVENDYLVPGTTLVSFEDLPGAENQEFNDLSFSFTGTVAGAVPEPATWALMILGFGAVGGALRRRQATKATVRFA